MFALRVILIGLLAQQLDKHAECQEKHAKYDHRYFSCGSDWSQDLYWSNAPGWRGHRGSIEGGLENGTAFSVVAPMQRPWSRLRSILSRLVEGEMRGRACSMRARVRRRADEQAILCRMLLYPLDQRAPGEPGEHRECSDGRQLRGATEQGRFQVAGGHRRLRRSTDR